MALAKAQEWGGGQPQAPHWMRLLEEKYQRLHAKIVNQAARFSHRRRASLAANRVLRESQQRKHTRTCSRINTAVDQDALVKDQELFGVEQTTTSVDRQNQRQSEGQRQQNRIEQDEHIEEINGAIISADRSLPQQVLRAKTAKSLSKCVIKQRSTDHSINPRPQTQHGTRSSGCFIGTDSDEQAHALGDISSSGCCNCNTTCININQIGNNNNSKVTPLSSGVVTRVSSAYPFTRLSSAYCDNSDTIQSRPSPRIIVSNYDETDQEIDIEQLTVELNLQLENEENEFDNNEEDFVLTTTLHLEGLVEDGKCCCYSRPSGTTGQKDEFIMNVKCHTDRDDVTGRGQRRRRAVTRPVKTSVSRISHKTTKSCPATLLDIHAETENFNNNDDNNNSINTVNAFGNLVENNNNKNEFGSRRNFHVSSNSSHSLLPPKGAPKAGLSLEPLTGHGVKAGRMRVFARMSLEARHAIDETLKEMKTEERLQQELLLQQQQQQQIAKAADRADEEPSFVDGSVNNNNTSADSIRNNVSVKTGDDQPSADQRLRSTVPDYKTHQNDGVDDFSSNASVQSNDSHVYATNKGVQNNTNTNTKKDGVGSVASRNKPPPYKDNNNNQIPGISLDNKLNSNSNQSRRLPQIGENTDTFRDSFPTPHAPLPAIRQINRTFRENTFEITPPDFDIRFREIITCQKGDRETPPLDVRQESIDKCQQWLVRYTPRR